MQFTNNDWLKLIRANGIGNRTLFPLLEQSKNIDELLKLADPESVRKINAALNNPDIELHEKDLKWLDTDNNHLITCHDSLYPELLRQTPDPPIALFIHGNPNLLSLPQLAIVGSRNPSKTGKDNAFAFARYLAESGLLITSGLALGIDGQAHKGCLAGKGRTVAVTGTGLDRIYPASHRDLAHEIAEQGVIVSELPPGTPPKPGNFPRRNRIISGLSLGTLVVEATIKSGSLITAHQAIEQGREVFAIPGSIHNPQSKGCHKLIKEGAKLVESAADIIEELSAMFHSLEFDFNNKNPKNNPPEKSDEINILDEEYLFLLDNMGWDPISTEELIASTQLKPEAISSMLLLLELQGHVSSAPGGYYNRTAPTR